MPTPFTAYTYAKLSRWCKPMRTNPSSFLLVWALSGSPLASPTHRTSCSRRRPIFFRHALIARCSVQARRIDSSTSRVHSSWRPKSDACAMCACRKSRRAATSTRASPRPSSCSMAVALSTALCTSCPTVLCMACVRPISHSSACRSVLTGWHSGTVCPSPDAMPTILCAASNSTLSTVLKSGARCGRRVCGRASWDTSRSSWASDTK
mmetsp:Transcript_28983/g.86305  ORF Transcript_28983/g.86305 Transcript_28983/m.86305 type:complete len:208 (-) Transcript_28983:364-987(-)